MKDQILRLLKKSEYDEAILKLKHLLENSHCYQDEFITIEEQWERFKNGIAMGTYKLEQIDSVMKSDLEKLIQSIDFAQLPNKNETVIDGSGYEDYVERFAKKQEEHPKELKYVGFWKRALIRLIDSAISWLLFPLDYAILKFAFENNTIVPVMIFTYLLFSVQIFLVIRFGGTIGKLIMGVRIIDKSGKFLNLEGAFLRDIPYILKATIYLIAISYTVDAIQPNMQIDSFMQMGILMLVHAKIIVTFSRYLDFFVLVDVLTVAFNKKKRAIHDYLAGSYVVSRDSMLDKKLMHNQL